MTDREVAESIPRSSLLIASVMSGYWLSCGETDLHWVRVGVRPRVAIVVTSARRRKESVSLKLRFQGLQRRVRLIVIV